MAKTTAPLLSLGASGTIAKTMTFGSWKGVGYVRQRVVPANPKTAAQSETRNVFREASNSFRLLPSTVVDAFAAFTTGRALTTRNAYTSEFVRQLRGKNDLADWVTSPGARGGPALASFAGVAGALAGEIDLTYGLPTAPAGWAAASLQVVASPDHNPEEPWVDPIDAFPDAALTGSLTIDNLTPNTLYAVSAHIVWTRPDGASAFSVSRTALITSAA